MIRRRQQVSSMSAGYKAANLQERSVNCTVYYIMRMMKSIQGIEHKKELVFNLEAFLSWHLPRNGTSWRNETLWRTYEKKFIVDFFCFLAIKQYSPDKPVLVFVSSRRQTRLTAIDLMGFVVVESDPKQWLRMPEHEVCSVFTFQHWLHHWMLPNYYYQMEQILNSEW